MYHKITYGLHVQYREKVSVSLDKHALWFNYMISIYKRMFAFIDRFSKFFWLTYCTFRNVWKKLRQKIA